jgi:hypothetical protein
MPLLILLGVIVLLAGVAFGAPRSYKPDIRCPQGPTASKTQSKLWFNDGAWWGILFDGSSEEYRIHRYDRAEDAWSDTGTLVDARNASRADVLWDDGHLYVVSAGTEVDLEEHGARFLRYSYDPSAERYSLDEGFPVEIADGGTEAISIARDTTGQLWATYTQTQSEQTRRVYVTHTEGGDDSHWVEPFVPPLEGTTVSPDDVSGIVAFGSQVGLAWGNQYDAGGKPGYYFATHKDGTPDDEWQPDGIVKGAGWSNDHLNLKADSEGRVYVALKTRWDRVDRGLDKPYSMLWVRDQQGEWTSHVFGTVGDAHTRSLVLIDEERRQLFMVASAPTCSGGKVYYKETSLDDISFEKGRGDLLMQSTDGAAIGDATSTKQNIDETDGGLVLASDKARKYYYNLIDPSSQQEKVFPDGSRLTTIGEGG